MNNPVEIKEAPSGESPPSPVEKGRWYSLVAGMVVPNNALTSHDADPKTAQELNSSDPNKLTGDTAKKLEKELVRTLAAGTAAGIGAAVIPTFTAEASPPPIVQENNQAQTGDNIQLVKNPGIAPQTVENLVNKYFPNALEASGLQMPQEFIQLHEAVGDGKIQRGELQGVPWMFGPNKDVPITYETYNGKQRIVAYFHKARMEEGGTTGLLAKELITGQMQTGDATFEFKGPADIAAVGDKVPGNITYKELSQNQYQTVEPNQFEQRTVNEFKNFFRESGKRIPGTTDEFAYNRGIELIGNPITEAKWVKAKVGGVEKDVLVQAFERRVLTYTPDNDDPWKVEMGNIGQHYNKWRYGEGGTGGQETEIKTHHFQGKGWYFESDVESFLRVEPGDRAILDQIEAKLKENGIVKPDGTPGEVIIMFAKNEDRAIRMAKQFFGTDLTSNDFMLFYMGSGYGVSVGKEWNNGKEWAGLFYPLENMKQFAKEDIASHLVGEALGSAVGSSIDREKYWDRYVSVYNQVIPLLWKNINVEFN